MPLTPDDVQNKRFTVVRFGKSGYDEEEVDSFLDEVEAEMRRLLADPGLAKDAGAPLPPPPAPVPAAVVEPAPAAPPVPPAPPAAPVEAPNETALRTLALAQQTAEQLTSEAKTEADRLVGAARLRATALQQEAESTHASTLADLAQQRAKVESEIAALRTYERDYRTRLRAYLEGQLDDLEQLTIVAEGGPQGSPAAVRPAAAPGTPATPALGQSPTLATVTSPPTPSVAAATGGPFSTAPAPASGLFAAAPSAPATATAPAAAAGPAGPALGGPPSTIDTDVDAASDAPSGPPAEADLDGTDTLGD